jgi:hypothetical protein
VAWSVAYGPNVPICESLKAHQCGRTGFHLKVSPSNRKPEEAVQMKDEANYICDSCGEEILAPSDLPTGPEREYVEDCPVCRCPNVVHVEVDEDGDVQVWAARERIRMTPLHHDPHFTYRYAEDRIMPRCHLEASRLACRSSRLTPLQANGLACWKDLETKRHEALKNGFLWCRSPESESNLALSLEV